MLIRLSCISFFVTLSICASAFDPDESCDEKAVELAPSGSVLLQTRRLRKDANLTDESTGTHAPCGCVSESPNWKTPVRRPGRCIFIDLGAADGNTYQRFLQGDYGAVKSCPSGGSYEALLVEANPFFDIPLRKLAGERVASHSTGRVRTFTSTAAYMCEGSTDFYLDTVDVKEDFWGSSLSPNTRDVLRSGKKRVTVSTVNVAQLIVENTLPEDFVIVKMDIEGAEWDILPCLANSSAAKLIDALYVEKHPKQWSLLGVEDATYEAALFKLRQKGVFAPPYDSPM